MSDSQEALINRRLAEINKQIADAKSECAKAVLPPNDPESPEYQDMNGQRSGWAQAGLMAYAAATGSDLQDLIADLIGDLGHFCDRHGLDLRHELDRGEEMYRFETQEKGKQFE
jgi:hypothetical protein